MNIRCGRAFASMNRERDIARLRGAPEGAAPIEGPRARRAKYGVSVNQDRGWAPGGATWRLLLSMHIIKPDSG